MKNILLIGDSIRAGISEESPGYGVYVKEKLAGWANVISFNDNCRFAQYTLRYLYDWSRQVEADKIDIIHWNNGLWDVLHLDGDEVFTPVDWYIETLRRIYNMMRKRFPNAKIIFATSTSVEESMGDSTFFRYNKEIEEYNKAASELMENLGVAVNDLYEVSKDFSTDMRVDWVHYNSKGSEILADKVVEKIKELA